MNVRRATTLAVLLSLAPAACASDRALVDEVSALSAQLDGLQQQVEDLDAELQQQGEVLDAELQAVRGEVEAAAGEHDEPMEAASEAEHSHEASAFEVAVAQYLLDTAGFHAMDEALNEAGQIDPGYSSNVSRVHKVLSSTTWPEALDGSVASFLELLLALGAALADDDLETAAPLATEAHELQHGLSHDIDAWLGGGAAGHGHDE